MNLTKYFNINYLKENLKKSRGLIILLMIAVPFFTILSLVFMWNSQKYTEILNDAQVAIPNVIGMYIIPFLLSYSLFGYVYKKSSVDFVNSMPINRKAIFITNAVAGILLITLLQLITFIVSLICNAFVSTITIFPSMLIDIFITMWIAYFFMFCATNLAMTFSGTALTQVVLTMIIIFIIPFCMLTFNEIIENANEIESENYINESIFRAEYNEKTYTLPFNVISSNVNTLYSSVANIKMLVLGIVYLILGVYFFQNRKMENAEESFSTDKVHLFVKALTVFPMIVILNLMDSESGFLIVAIGFVIIYYFAYDFIIKRRIKFSVSVVSLIVTLIVSQLIVFGVKHVKSENVNIQKEDIDKIALCLDDNYTGFNYNKDLFIDNPEIIDFIYDSAKEGKKLRADLYEKATQENAKEIYFPEIYLRLSVVLKNGKNCWVSVDLKEEDFWKLIELLENNQNYVENVKNEYFKKSLICMGNRVVMENVDEINRVIEKEIQNMSLKEILDMNSNNEISLSKVYYNNHRLINKSFSLNKSKEILNFIIENENKFFKENLENEKKSDIRSQNFNLLEGELGYDSDEFRKFHGSFSYTNVNVQKFVEDNINEKCDVDKQIYCIRTHSYYAGCSMYFFTNKVDELNEIIKLEEEQIKIYEDRNIDIKYED